MSIYVTGDTHGTLNIKSISSKQWKESKMLTKNIYSLVFFKADISFEEVENAEKNLKRYNNEVDYIITHTLPKKLIGYVDYVKDISDSTSAYLENIFDNVKYEKWVCGHFHVDSCFEKYNIFILYNKIFNIEELDSDKLIIKYQMVKNCHNI